MMEITLSTLAWFGLISFFLFSSPCAASPSTWG